MVAACAESKLGAAESSEWCKMAEAVVAERRKQVSARIRKPRVRRNYKERSDIGADGACVRGAKDVGI